MTLRDSRGRFVSVKDRGANALLRRVADFGKCRIKFGVLGGQRAEIAAYHEFGLGVPQRSFIGAWVDANETAMRARASRDLEAWAAGKLSRAQVVQRLGLFAVGGIVRRMSAGIPPSLAPATIRRKGSSTPLIDTGLLRASVSFVEA